MSQMWFRDNYSPDIDGSWHVINVCTKLHSSIHKVHTIHSRDQIVGNQYLPFESSFENFANNSLIVLLSYSSATLRTAFLKLSLNMEKNLTPLSGNMYSKSILIWNCEYSDFKKTKDRSTTQRGEGPHHKLFFEDENNIDIQEARWSCGFLHSNVCNVM